MRDPVSKEMDGTPEDDSQECLATTCMYTHMHLYSHKQAHKYTYIVFEVKERMNCQSSSNYGLSMDGRCFCLLRGVFGALAGGAELRSLSV